MSEKIVLTVNGKKEVFNLGNESRYDIPYEETLSFTLRERLNLTGTKEACSQGACGCCTVLMNGEAVPSCQILTSTCNGAEIVTIEGLEDPKTHELDPIQQAFIDEYAFQCGFCTPGIVMATKGVLLKNPTPTHDEIAEALSGNQCRCISQYHVFNAVESVVQKMQGGEK